MTTQWGYPDGMCPEGGWLKPSSRGMSYFVLLYRTNLILVKYQWKQQLADPINNQMTAAQMQTEVSRTNPIDPQLRTCTLKYQLNKI